MHYPNQMLVKQIRPTQNVVTFVDLDCSSLLGPFGAFLQPSYSKMEYNIDLSLNKLLLLFVPFLSDFTIWEGSEMNLNSV